MLRPDYTSQLTTGPGSSLAPLQPPPPALLRPLAGGAVVAFGVAVAAGGPRAGRLSCPDRPARRWRSMQPPPPRLAWWAKLGWFLGRRKGGIKKSVEREGAQESTAKAPFLFCQVQETA